MSAWRGSSLLYLACPCLGGALGVLALITVVHPKVLINFDSLLLGVPFAYVIGGIVGFATSPLVVACLRWKNIWLAMSLAYGATAVAVIVAALRSDFPFGITAAPPGVGALAVASVVLWLVLPGRAPYGKGLCAACGYRLDSLAGERCPECGMAERDRAAAYALRGTRRQGRTTVGLAALVLGTGVALCLPSWIARMKFSPERFESIVAGMTTDEVRSRLGPPDRDNGAVMSWSPDAALTLFGTEYCVYVSDDRVVGAEVYRD